MQLKSFQVCHLAADKIGSQKLPGLMPGGSVCSEDAMPEQGVKGGLPPIRQVEVLEAGRQHRFQVLGIDCHDDIDVEDLESEGMRPILLKSVPIGIQKFMGVISRRLSPKNRPAKDRVRKSIQARLRFDWLASMFFDQTSTRSPNRQLPIDVIESIKEKASKDCARQAGELEPRHESKDAQGVKVKETSLNSGKRGGSYYSIHSDCSMEETAK